MQVRGLARYHPSLLINMTLSILFYSVTTVSGLAHPLPTRDVLVAGQVVFLFLCSPEGTWWPTMSLTELTVIPKDYDPATEASHTPSSSGLPGLPWFLEHFRSVTWVKGPRPKTRVCPSEGRKMGGAPPGGLSSHRRPRASNSDILGTSLRANK